MAQLAPLPHSAPEDLLVPRLDLPVGAPDPVAISTWHLAVSSLIGDLVPHQLFGLWVFPEVGDPVLLGPEALAQDQLEIPRPDPFLSQDALFELEERLRQAEYASAMAVPIHGAERDVGLALVGTFKARAYGPSQMRQLQRLSGQLNTTLEPLSRAIRGKGGPSAILSRPPADDLPAALARTISESPTGPELVRRLSGVIHGHLPHDRLELVAYANGSSAAIPMSGAAARRRWGTPSPTWLDLARALEPSLGDDRTAAIENLAELAPTLAWPTGGSLPVRTHSLLVARLTLGEQPIGLLVLGHAGEDVYRPVDEELATTVARLVSARVAALRLEAELHTVRGQLEALRSPSLPVIRAAEALAATGHLGEALHRFGAEVHEVVPHDGLRFVLWSGQETVAFRADGIQPLANLPRLAIAGMPERAVLEGEQDWLHTLTESGAELAVPLDVAARRVGLLVFEAAAFEAPRDAAAAIRPFATLLAPHLELVRRAALSPSVIDPAAESAPRPGE